MAQPEIGESRSARSRGGRPPLPLGLRRDQQFRVSFTFHDAEDIREIAEAWDVPVGIAVWAIVMSQLARWRRTAPKYGKHGLAIGAGLQVLRQKWAEERSETRGGSSDAE